MRRAGACALAACALLGGPGAATAQEGAGPRVSVLYASYSPARITVLTGDTVTWTNDSVRVHTVTAQDVSFDSGRLPSTDTFAHRFAAPGLVPYFCRLHPSIQGEVDVEDLLLKAPGVPAGPGRAFPLAGRAALPEGTEVTLEGDAGDGFRPVGTATVDADGAFTASVAPTTTTRFRAVAGERRSAPVQVVVLDHTVAVSRTRAGRRFTVTA